MRIGNLHGIIGLLATIAVVLGAASCGDRKVAPSGAAGTAALAGAGGSDDATAGSSAGGDDSRDTPAAGGATGAPEAPLYAMTSNIWGVDGAATGYLFTLPSLDAGDVELSSAREFPGGAWLLGHPTEPYIYVSSGEGGATVTRWEVAPDGELIDEVTISFEGHGITSGIRAGTAVIVSATKAYLLDHQNGWLVSWNPRDMEVGEVLELALEQRDGVAPVLTGIAARHDRVFVSAAWESDWQWQGGARIITIDVGTDEVVASEDDSRCEALNVSGTASDGTLYFAPLAFQAGARSVLDAEFGTGSCALRIVPPDEALDQAWEVDLAALAGGRAAGGFTLASDDVGFFRVYYQDEIGATPENFSDSLALPAYRWWRWDIGADQAEELEGQDLSHEATSYAVGGKTYIGNASVDWSSTTLFELDAIGGLRQGITVPGTPGGVVRVR